MSGASSASSAVRRDTDNRPDPGEGEEKEETVRKLDEVRTWAGINGDTLNK